MSMSAAGTRDPRMLSGVTAFGWARVGVVVYLLGFFFFAGLSLVFLAHLSDSPLLLVFMIPAIASGFLASISALVSSAQQRAEAAAGYTTLPATSPNLDQLDYRSGALIRRAGEPLLKSRGVFAYITGDPGMRPTATPRESVFPPRSAGGNALWFLSRFGIIAFGLVALYFRGARDPVVSIITVVSVIAFGVLLFAVIAIVTRLTLGRRIREIAAQRPGSFVFTSTTTSDVRQGLERIGRPLDAATGRFPVAVTPAALELWSNADPPELRSSVPWSEVTSIEPGSTIVGRSSFKTLDIRIDHGVPAQLNLPLYGRNGIGSASIAWANYILDAARRKRHGLM